MRPPSPSCNVHENPSCWKHGGTKAGCISRTLRRILCFSSIPSCSFDHFKEDERESSVIIGATGTTPGLVARLKGLESLPRFQQSEESSSMSSADSFKKLRSPPQLRPRRITPAYQEIEDENFFILNFERGGDIHESSVRRRRSGKNSIRMEQSVGDNKSKKKKMRRTKCSQGKNKKNEQVNMVFRDDYKVGNSENVLRPLKNPCQNTEEQQTKRASRDNNSMAVAISFETEGDSENWSPNSVLEFVEFTTDQGSAHLGEISRLANSKMRRQLSDELDNCGNYREKNLKINNGDGEKEKPSCRLRNRDQNYAGKWDEIRELAAAETMQCSWLDNEIHKNQHCFMETGRDIASSILDLLLDELLINLGKF